MDSSEDDDKNYTPNYAYVGPYARFNRDMMRMVSELIEKLEDQNPYSSIPPLKTELEIPDGRAYLVSYLEESRLHFVNKNLDEIRYLVKNADADVRSQVINSASSEMRDYPTTVFQIKPLREKDQYANQENIEFLFPIGPALNEKDDTGQVVDETENIDTNLVSMSARFSQGLSFTKAEQNITRTTEISQGRETDKDRE